MKLTILGKYGPYPEGKNSACSGYLVEDKDTTILVDCGTGVLGRLIDYMDVRKLNAVYLTHLHYDHTSDLLPFHYLLDDLNYDLHIYLKRTFTPYEEILINNKHIIVHDISECRTEEIGNLKLDFYQMKHPLLNYGVLIQGSINLGITGDTVICNNVFELARKSNYLLADCLKSFNYKGPHMSAENAFEIIEKTDVKLLITHASPFHNIGNIFYKEKNITVVEELKTYQLN